VNCFLTTILLVLVIMPLFSTAFAHQTVNVDKYEIEVGWDIEPPIVGFRNSITFEISEVESESVKAGVTNAFKNLQAIAKFGGITKTLDINSDPRAGHYFSNIIPTRTGTIEIDLKGEINGVAVDVSIPVEDVETTAVLDFPPSTSSSGQDVAALKNAVSSLQQDISQIKSKIDTINLNSANVSIDDAYKFGVLGMSLGAAAVILSVIIMTKRK